MQVCKLNSKKQDLCTFRMMSQLFLEGFFEIKPIYALPSFSGEQIATKLRGSFKEVVHAINSG